MNSYELKVKIKSLAAEARIIRADERKHRESARWLRSGPALRVPELRDKEKRDKEIERHDAVCESLHHHRTVDVRRSARETHLAYGFLRGTPYKKMESKCYTAPQWGNVEKMAVKYATSFDGDIRVIKQKFAEWIAAA